jgi:MFS family permease
MSDRRSATAFVAISLVAGFGSTAMSLTAAVWAKTLTGSSGLAALAGFFVFLPTLAGPALGAIVDRLPVRPVLVVTNLAMAGLLLTLLTVESARGLGLLYAVMFGYGVSYVTVDAAEARLLAAALAPEALGRMNGARMSAQEATKLVAPLAGAGLFAWQGGGAVATLSAAALAGSAALYPLVRPRQPFPARASDRPLWTEVADGVRYLRGHRDIRVPVLVASIAMLLSGLGNAAVYSVVETALRRPPAFVGVLSSVQGAGAIVGGLLAGRLMERLGETALAVMGVAVFALGPLAQAIGWLPAVIGGSALVGIGLPWTIVAGMTAVQRHTPADRLGRVAASAGTAMFAPPAIGIPLGALLVSVIDYRIQLVTAALVALAVAVFTRGPAERTASRGAPS